MDTQSKFQGTAVYLVLPRTVAILDSRKGTAVSRPAEDVGDNRVWCSDAVSRPAEDGDGTRFWRS